MGETPADIQRQITEFELALKQPIPDSVRQSLETQLAALRQQAHQQPAATLPAATPSAAGSVIASGDAHIGQAIGVNLGTIIYGRDPKEDERTQLVNYLERLAAKLAMLPMRGLADDLHRGKGVTLLSVYTMLATEQLVEFDKGDSNVLNKYFDGNTDESIKQQYNPEYVLPCNAIARRDFTTIDSNSGIVLGNTREFIPVLEKDYSSESRESLPEGGIFSLSRALLATEAVSQHRQCVLLGAPGGGKSTFMRYLAWSFAQRGLDRTSDDTALYGWDDSERVLPVLLPLRTLAGSLHNVPENQWDTTVSAALQATMAEYDYDKQDAIGLLRESLRRGKALLLFDGLDEVPVGTTPNAANRITTLEAVRSFIHLYPDTLAVITCRTRAFSDDLRDCLAWQVETIAPFTMGQVRHFVPAWYRELAAKTDLNDKEATNMAAQLVAAIVDNEKLREMAGTPLLLTMMALILYHKGELPRDRPRLYEELLRLLLGQWDMVKEVDGHKLPSLGELMGRPTWTSDYILPLLDSLSYEAHATATSQDGRGRLDRGRLFTVLYDFFGNAGMTPAEAGGATAGLLDYIDQRSGLLVPDGTDSYTFAHLTLQEHGAGRHIALTSDDPVELVMAHRSDDRWREPIFLGMGVADQRDINNVLEDLLDRDEQGQPKPLARWYRDLILATELGADRDWSYLKTQKRVKVDKHQQALRRGLVTLLNDAEQPLPVRERVRAGFLLGDLGDPRFPVTPQEWQREWERAQSGDPNGYFCKVDAGTYLIGSSDDDPNARDEEKPQYPVTFEHPFWVARYPLTNAQWQAWVQAGGRQSRYGDDRDLNRLNQPVVGVRWDWCNEFCCWIQQQTGIDMDLPTEAQWEAAARGGDGRRYPWGDAWQADCAATEKDRETRGSRYTVPIGCYPLGASPAGVLDMAGNVWEWTADVWRSHPGAAKLFEDKDDRVLKGGAYLNSSTGVRCAARFRSRLVLVLSDNGVRVSVSPRLPERMC